MTWTQKEIAVLHKHYATGGVHAVQKQLKKRGYDRSTHAIYNKAIRLMVDDTPTHMVPLSSVHPKGDRALTPATRAYKQAQQDGVLKERPNRLRRYLVPTWWADQYIQQLEERREADASDWWSTTRFAERLGMDRRRLWRIRKRKAPHPLADRIRAIPTRKGFNTPATYYEPTAAQTIVNLNKSLTP